MDLNSIHFPQIKKVSSINTVMFLETMLESSPLSNQILETLDMKYQLSTVKNAEVKCTWLKLCLNSKYVASYETAIEFLISYGRMKYARPIYRALGKCDLVLAQETFKKHQQFYHPICANMVSKDLKLQ